MATSTRQNVGLAPTLRNTLIEGDGGVLRVLTNTIAFGDTTVKTLFTLPANAILIGIDVNVTTVFNSSGTDLLSIGKSGTNTHYKNGLDVSALGQTVTGWSNLGVSATTDLVIVGIYAQSVADSTTGACRISFRYIDV